MQFLFSGLQAFSVLARNSGKACDMCGLFHAVGSKKEDETPRRSRSLQTASTKHEEKFASY